MSNIKAIAALATMVKCGVDKAKPRVELTLWPYLNGATA